VTIDSGDEIEELPAQTGVREEDEHDRGRKDTGEPSGTQDGLIARVIAPPPWVEPSSATRSRSAFVTETGRLETFADGVFAIAITLLVLAIRLPAPNEDLGKALVAQWPEFVAYIVSFLTVGIMWEQHHRLFTLISRSNPTFAMINIVFLMFVAFVPYPTGVLAQRLGSGVDALGGTLLYGGTMVAIAIMFNAIWRYASARDGHLLVGLSPEARRAEARGYRYGVPVYLLITLLAFLNPILSLAGFGAFAAYWALPISGPSREG
jgi:uncharacterized membrane protein